jgi:hypothetical protein
MTSSLGILPSPDSRLKCQLSNTMYIKIVLREKVEEEEIVYGKFSIKTRIPTDP